ncbi:hypothetical protein VTI74DRAFT_4173 [Chaetomium olivicolor]
MAAQTPQVPSQSRNCATPLWQSQILIWLPLLGPNAPVLARAAPAVCNNGLFEKHFHRTRAVSSLPFPCQRCSGESSPGPATKPVSKWACMITSPSSGRLQTSPEVSSIAGVREAACPLEKDLFPRTLAFCHLTRFPAFHLSFFFPLFGLAGSPHSLLTSTLLSEPASRQSFPPVQK